MKPGIDPAALDRAAAAIDAAPSCAGSRELARLAIEAAREPGRIIPDNPRWFGGDPPVKFYYLIPVSSEEVTLA